MSFFKRNITVEQPFVPDSTEHVVNMLNLAMNDWNDSVFSGLDVLSNADVMSAVNMIATDVAGLKLTTKDLEADKDLLKLLNVRPNATMTAYNLKFAIVLNLIIYGNSYVEIVRNETGRAIELYFIQNSDVTIKKMRDSFRVKEIIYEVKSLDGKSIKKVKSNDMLHYKLMSTDGIVGQSLLKALQNELSVSKNSKQFLDSFFRHGTHSGGMIKTDEDLSPEDVKILQDQFQQANAGMNNANKVMILPNGLDYDAIKVDTELIKMINNNNSSKASIASVLGIPLHKMGLTTSNMNLAQLNQDYLISTLKAYLDIILSELYKLDEQMEIEFDFNTDDYTNIDTKQLHENLRIERELGFINVDEGRAKLGLKPLNNEIGTQYITNLNYVDSEIANEYQLNKATSKGGEMTNE